MKINRLNPMHLCCLALFGGNTLLARLLRHMLPRKTSGEVIFYGHRLSGNLLALQQHCTLNPHLGIRPVFLTMDIAYARKLRAEGIACSMAVGLGCIVHLWRARAIVSDHGLHAMQILLGTPDLQFFDVWHGIPFKGFDADDFRVQHRYTEIWVASPLLKRLYVERFGFPEGRVHATGYARTDTLLAAAADRDDIAHRLGLKLPEGKRCVLFAPTWKQDAHRRALFPFGVDGETFLARLAETCRAANAVVLFRAHLNSREQVRLPEDVIAVPFAHFPDTESVLLLSDVLICDWSSIAFDFLLLDRPTLFLDVAPPFRKGFSLGPEYRFGQIVNDFDALLSALDRAIVNPDAYRTEFSARHERIREAIYGPYADGRASERCIRRLLDAIR